MSITKEGLFRYQVLNERQKKNLMILDALRRKGPITKADLSKNLGYNIVTLSNYVDEYLAKGIAVEDGTEVSKGGRKPVLIELNNREIFFIGIDFSQEAFRAVATDFMLKVIAEAQAPRPKIEQDAVSEALISLIKGIIKKAGVAPSKIKFIGIGTYGMIDEKNKALKGLDEEKGRSRATIYFTALKNDIEKEFNIPAFFGTDAMFAAFGERAVNPDADAENMLYIFKDVGKGVIIKGEVYCGTNITGADMEGLTGILSHEEKSRILDDSLYLKPWNAQMSLKKEALKFIGRGVGTKIVEFVKGDMDQLTDDIIMKAAGVRDELAIDVVEGIGINLGVRISYLINLFAPEVVIIGGGIEKAGEALFTQIKKTVQKLSLEKPKQATAILPSVAGENAVSLGAASVGLREVFLES